MEQRVDAYLRPHRLSGIINNGSAYHALLERIMISIGAALRTGLLVRPNAKEGP
jgi:hypothetical protein